MTMVVTPQPNTPADALDLAGRAAMRVLVVDRQPLFAQALRSLLAGPPALAAVRSGTNTDGARELAATGELDLVLCDVLAGPVGGAALARELAALTPQVPVILLGELPELVPVIGLLLDGVAGLFTKDVGADELLIGAAAVLAGHRAVSAPVLEVALAARAEAAPALPAADGLSPSEREVLALLAQARSVAAIAEARGISPKTVRNHMASIYRKLSLRNRTEAMLYAARLGLVVL